MSWRRRMHTANRFDNYSEIEARFDSEGKCGHKIRKGDRIGYHRVHGAQCSDCWRRWVAENQEADMLEASGSYPG